MTKEHKCGPKADVEFFARIRQVMKEFPEAARKYHIVCVDHETDQLGVNFKQTVSVKRIEGNRIITDFKPRSQIAEDDEDGDPGSPCCEWGVDDLGRDYCASWWT